MYALAGFFFHVGYIHRKVPSYSLGTVQANPPVKDHVVFISSFADRVVFILTTLPL